MSKEELEQLRFPTGRYHPKENYSPEMIEEFIQVIDQLPKKLREVVKTLSDKQLDTPYRDGGWTVRQVVHHLPDSHMNSYVRFKLAVTEDTPTIRPYFEERWAELEEAKHGPVDISLNLLEALHKRWVLFLKNLSADDWKKKLHHPATNRNFQLDAFLHLYAWHCNHHLTHITSLIDREGWNKN